MTQTLEQKRAWYHRNKEKVLEQQSIYRKSTKGKAARKAHRAKNYEAINASLRNHFSQVSSEFYEWKTSKGCCVCGYSENADALQIDHIVPVLRTSGSGSDNRPRSRAELHRLMARTDIQILCANCHAIKTAREHRDRAKEK